MLQSLNPASPAADAAMRAMFEARKRVFIDLLQWDLPVLAGRYELDQYDNSDARYLILSETGDDHLASARLLPTTRPHLLDSHFHALCDMPIPKGPGICEISRFCLDRRLGAARRREVRDRLVLGLVDHALENGIATYTGVAEPGWFQQVLAFGWACRPLGLPKKVDGMTLVALRIDIGPDTRARLAQAGIIKARRWLRAEAA